MQNCVFVKNTTEDVNSTLKLIKLVKFQNISRNFTLSEYRFAVPHTHANLNHFVRWKSEGTHSFVDSQRCSEWRVRFIISHFCVFDKAFNLFIVMMENAAYFN